MVVFLFACLFSSHVRFPPKSTSPRALECQQASKLTMRCWEPTGALAARQFSEFPISRDFCRAPRQKANRTLWNIGLGTTNLGAGLSSFGWDYYSLLLCMSALKAANLGGLRVQTAISDYACSSPPKALLRTLPLPRTHSNRPRRLPPLQNP